jgi:hypothetical protein
VDVTPHIDLDADLNMEDDDGRNFARVPPSGAPAVGSVLVAGRVGFWMRVRVAEVSDGFVYFRPVSA